MSMITPKVTATPGVVPSPPRIRTIHISKFRLLQHVGYGIMDQSSGLDNPARRWQCRITAQCTVWSMSAFPRYGLFHGRFPTYCTWSLFEISLRIKKHNEIISEICCHYLVDVSVCDAALKSTARCRVCTVSNFFSLCQRFSVQ